MYIPKRVEFWDDERHLGHGYIVTLLYGWSFEHNYHEGVRGFDTQREALEAIRDANPCECDECKSGGKL